MDRQGRVIMRVLGVIIVLGTRSCIASGMRMLRNKTSINIPQNTSSKKLLLEKKTTYIVNNRFPIFAQFEVKGL